MNSYSQTDYDSPAVDLRSILLQLWSGRWWIAGSALLFTGLFTAAAFLMTPKYLAETVVVAASVDGNGGTGQLSGALGQLGGFASLAGINIGATGNDVEETLAVLRSREFTERFIRDRNLMPKLFRGMWDARTKQWKGPKENWPTAAQAYRYFDKSVRSINRDKKTGLVTLGILWRDPREAAGWANGLVERLNAEMRARAIEKTNASVGYLEKELANTSTVETRQSINRLIENQINQRMLANVTGDYALRVVDRALPPDPKEIVRPNKPLLIALGPVLGVFVGGFMVLVVRAFASALRESPRGDRIS